MRLHELVKYVKEVPAIMTKEHSKPIREIQQLLNIDIIAAHPTLDPKQITEVLSTTPTYCWKNGDYRGSLKKQSSRWHGRLIDRSALDEFDGALKSVLSLLLKHKPFWEDFISGGGEIELILNQEVSHMEGKILELHFRPTLLGQLSTLGISLCVQGWNRQ